MNDYDYDYDSYDVVRLFDMHSMMTSMMHRMNIMKTMTVMFTIIIFRMTIKNSLFSYGDDTYEHDYEYADYEERNMYIHHKLMVIILMRCYVINITLIMLTGFLMIMAFAVMLLLMMIRLV